MSHERPAGERFGRYMLLESIGRGGMAEVFRAVAHGVEGFQRVFVIKRILQDKSQSKDFIDMFVSEARVSALLNHPNIVQIYDFGQISGSYFISMEYLRGKDLLSVMRQLRATRKSMDPAVAAFIAQQVALGLHYAHSLTGAGGKPLNIVHRDVSPSNIMLLRAGGVKLLDFGIAKVGVAKPVDSDPVGSDAFIRGKLSYLSPEQIRGDAIDGRSDVFSLGVCFWEMLTGRRLFFDKSELNTMKNVMDRPVMPPSMQRPELPTPLDYIAIRALERDGSRRYRNAKEMADELETYLADAHFAAGALPRLLDDLFGVDAGAFDAQVDEASSWADLPASQHVEPNKSRTVPPVLVDGTDAKRARESDPRSSRQNKIFALTGGVALAAGLAVFALRTGGPSAPPLPVVVTQPAPMAPAPAAVVAPPAPAPLAPVGETWVEVRLETHPRGADVIDEQGRVLGVTPTLIKVKKGATAMQLVLRKKGFADTVQPFVPDRDLSAVLSLRRAPKGVPPVEAPAPQVVANAARPLIEPDVAPAPDPAAAAPIAPAEPPAPEPQVVEPTGAGLAPINPPP
ncbi:MAG: serine/threonine-protein kinase [Deltaproteobacteria bacterium]|nr:serine/threonine-protein kinase [Deltaproteobacteria bacterium]